MILSISLENFYSIKDEVTVDFRAGALRSTAAEELSDNVIAWNGIKVLKTIGLFGPNASGKSNIIKAISFCCRMVLESQNNGPGTVFNFKPFKFDGWDRKPSRFSINFVCDSIEYEYTYSLTETQICSESLFYYPKGRKVKVFARDECDDNSRNQTDKEKKYSFGSSFSGQTLLSIAKLTGKENLFLSRAATTDNEFFRRLYTFFASKFLLGPVLLSDSLAEQLITSNRSIVLRALQLCDSDIVDMKLSKRKVLVQLPVPGTDGRSIAASPQVIEQLQLQTTHSHAKNVTFDLLQEESAGTLNLFQILLRILDVVRNRKSVMLDEFDANLHSLLTYFIIDLVHAGDSSQLLFTSHNTNLIDVKRFRRDQIVFVDKKEDGSTETYSLYDFKDFRENMDAEKGYLQGRFDAVPHVNTSVAELKHLIHDQEGV